MDIVSHRREFSTADLAVVLAIGCNGEPGPEPGVRSPPAAESSEKAQTLEAMTELLKEAEKDVPPAPVFELPLPEGWSRSPPRALPREDHGFSVAYEHPSGPTVTLYQYTRGQFPISDDLTAPAAVNEMRKSKNGIQQAVQLGLWDSAKEQADDTAKLGNSSCESLWSRYELRSRGEAAVSDIYVWVHKNAFLKVRCTSRADQEEGHHDALVSLLTAFGEACASR